MRLLFTCVPSHGRFFTIAALARSLVMRGHEVRVATARSIHGLVRGAGLRPETVGRSIDELRETVLTSQGPVLREDRMASTLFTKLWPEATLHDLLGVARAWLPDAIVHEEGELTAPLAATLLGLPSIAVSWTGPMRFERQWRSLEAGIAPVWRAQGLAPPPHAGMFRTLFLNQCPPLLQMQVACSAVRYALLRPALYDGADAWNGPALPLWDSPAHPLLFVTLGTVPAFYREPRIFQAIIDGLHNQPMNAVIAAGIDNPLVQSGDVPRNVQITGFVPQSLLNPQLAVVICHGGPGTTISALSHGIPLLLIPRGGAVQVRVAAACERAGVARVLSSGEVTAEGVRANVRELIENPSYRAAARQLAAQIEAMPDHDAAICQIERGVNSYHTTPIHDAAATQGLY